MDPQPLLPLLVQAFVPFVNVRSKIVHPLVVSESRGRSLEGTPHWAAHCAVYVKACIRRCASQAVHSHKQDLMSSLFPIFDVLLERAVLLECQS